MSGHRQSPEARSTRQTTTVRFRASELCRILDASLAGFDVDIDGATQDSRSLAPGMLFVPLVAERDGHDFIADAAANGAAAYLSERPRRADVAATAIIVADTAAALRVIGTNARHRLTGQVIAITGSVGKTSTKDLCAAAFGARWRTHASAKSFNNEIGVPLTLCNAPDDCEAAVVEMGARGLGHIAELCAIAAPTTAIVTLVGAAHLELFGDIDTVARAKGEIVESLPGSGLAVLNADDERVLAMRSRTTARVLTYGRLGEVRARDVVLDSELRPRFVVDTPWGSATVVLGARGAHNVTNALAAIGAAVAAGAPLEAVAAALGRPALSAWRMEVSRAPNGLLVINDAYNANPVSMRAALDALAAVTAVRRIAVLGPMAELGEGSVAAHRAAGAHAARLGIEVVAVATPHYGAMPVADADAALRALGAFGLGPNDAVLVKASRVNGLEGVAAALLDGGR